MLFGGFSLLCYMHATHCLVLSKHTLAKMLGSMMDVLFQDQGSDRSFVLTRLKLL